MPRKPSQKDFVMLTNARDRLVEALRKFDLYPNRGLDLAPIGRTTLWCTARRHDRFQDPSKETTK